MERDHVAANEIVACRGLWRDDEVNRGSTGGEPLKTGGVGIRAFFINLEPISRAVVGADVATSVFGEIDVHGPGMANVLVDGEANFVAGIDGLGLGRAPGPVGATDVAADVVVINASDGAVGIGDTTDIFVRLCGSSVDNQGFKVEVGQGRAKQSSQGYKLRKRKLHFLG